VEPLPLPNGKALSLVECSRESVDWKALTAAFVALGGNVDDYKKTTNYQQLRETKQETKS
jgi:hypothetical protein